MREHGGRQASDEAPVEAATVASRVAELNDLAFHVASVFGGTPQRRGIELVQLNIELLSLAMGSAQSEQTRARCRRTLANLRQRLHLLQGGDEAARYV